MKTDPTDWRKKPRKAPEKRLACNISFRVTPDLYERISGEARRRGLDIAALIRKTIEEAYGGMQ